MVSSQPRPSVRVSPVRARIEHWSHPALQRVAQLPPAIPMLIAAVLVVAGVALGLTVSGPLGAVLLLVVAAYLGWLIYLAWPKLPRVERLMRFAAVLPLLAVALVLAVPR